MIAAGSARSFTKLKLAKGGRGHSWEVSKLYMFFSKYDIFEWRGRGGVNNLARTYEHRSPPSHHSHTWTLSGFCCEGCCLEHWLSIIHVILIFFSLGWMLLLQSCSFQFVFAVGWCFLERAFFRLYFQPIPCNSFICIYELNELALKWRYCIRLVSYFKIKINL